MNLRVRRVIAGGGFDFVSAMVELAAASTSQMGREDEKVWCTGC
jgi:hypothetical protein